MLDCSTDLRRDAVRRYAGRNGLDFLEVGPDQLSLRVYMLGKLSGVLAEDGPDLVRHFRIEGGDVVSGIRILDVDPLIDPDPEVDDLLVLRLDRRGDFSTYTLRAIDVPDMDPRYDRLDFSFKVDCPSDVDCRPNDGCAPAPLDEPRLNYLAKDYASFRQLLFDRLALLVPDWTERHVPDLGVTLVELLAYVGDYLSYHQDAVATEAYIGTARQRISVRRHARLVDYRLHEGCNARAWVHVGVSTDTPAIGPDRIAFTTALDPQLGAPHRPVRKSALAGVPPSRFSWFEPVGDAPLVFREAHNEISLYSWGARDCCLPKGATRATLLDRWIAGEDEGEGQGSGRALHLSAGDYLLLEEVKGARTGVVADADPGRRWVVRLTRAEPAEDPLFTILEGDIERPTPLVEIEWAQADALPFALCLSAIGQGPACEALDGVSVARANLIMVDHGRTFAGEALPPVPESMEGGCCECAGQPAEILRRAGPYRPRLRGGPIVHRVAEVAGAAATALLQEPRDALPAIVVTEEEGGIWRPVPDLIGAGSDDRAFVAEIDNDGIAQLRFGDGRLGRAPDVGMALHATYRVGGGRDGNVGADSITRIVFDDAEMLDGVDFRIRNPLPATGGIDSEPIAQARLHAPSAFRRQRRAITAEDYATAASAHPGLQRAAASLVWTGAWWEAVVTIDPLGRKNADPALIAAVERRLEPYRRIGHDLRVLGADYVPIELGIAICALPDHDRGQVRKAVEARLIGPDGLFHPDRLSFGEGVFLSRIIAATMAVPGVECATVTALNRRFQHPNGELAAGVLPLGPNEIAQLENDPNHPERGRLELVVRGGR